MESFKEHTGRGAAIDRPNIDTDQIIPKQFLKRIERTGYGDYLFYDWRFASDGTPTADFVLNDPEFAGASILIAGENFGCGSSREHAPWSILDHGFRVVIAPSFADIFYNNSLKNGLLPVVLARTEVTELCELVKKEPKTEITVKLTDSTVSIPNEFAATFEIDEFSRHRLINGLDDIGLTLQLETHITNYEMLKAYHRK